MGGVKRRNGRFWVMKSINVDKDGYLTTYAYNQELEKETTVRIHRLVALNFLTNEKGYPVVHHKNGIKYDNRVDNLEWTTISDNTKRGFETYDSPMARKLKVTTEDGFVAYYPSYRATTVGLGIKNRNLLQKFVDKKPFLGFIHIEHVDEIDINYLNIPLVTKEIDISKFNPIKIKIDDELVYFYNGKEASDKLGIAHNRINRATRRGIDYELGEVTLVTPKEYLTAIGALTYVNKTGNTESVQRL